MRPFPITTWTTGDIDTVLDVRALSNATEAAAARLVEAGFEPQPYADGLTYRFIRASDVVDVLCAGQRRNARSKVGAETTAQLVWILAERLPEPEGGGQADEEMPGHTPHLAAAC